MMKSFFKKFIFLTCLLPVVSARLYLSEMFNFELKEYIPYIIVSTIILIAMFPTRRFTKFRSLIWVALGAFAWLIFPPLFFYVHQGLSITTIIMLTFNSIMVLYEIIHVIISLIIMVKEPKKNIETSLLYLSFWPIILMDTFKNNRILKIIATTFMVLFIISFLGSMITVWVNFLDSDYDHKAFTIFLVINFIIGCCMNCCLIPVVSSIVYYIISEINHYYIFYTLSNEVNKISLLLFWTDLWSLLSSIYLIIDCYFDEEQKMMMDDDDEMDDPKFDCEKKLGY
ncbi:hypothetical protein F8M41_016145 [Gigaspora margarita]|uniref:Uncharacterized protein n=1 Tax=Gigaspora margarita TaxID=4874 RepID=A0A8H3WX62_GIGMA|nr:hypothetical protein F8M41_016145 [Gigaspora margarita]